MPILNPPPKLDTIDVRRIRSWLNSLRDYVAALPKNGDMKSVVVSNGTISVLPQPRSANGGSGGGEYNGAFKVEKLTDTSLRVRGYEDDWKVRNYIILGFVRLDLATTTLTDIACEGFVYLDITYSSTYTCVAKYGASLPSQDNSHIYHPIAFVERSSNKISKITQMQYGIIHYPARFL